MEVNSGSASSTSYSRPANRLRIVSIKDVHDLAHGGGGIPKRLLLLVAQVELDDLLDAGRAHLHRHAHVQTVDAVLALEVRRARKEALLVEQHRVDHLRARRSRRVPGGGPEQIDDLAAADGGALDELAEACVVHEFPERRAAHDGCRGDRNHLVAVPAEDHRAYVLRGRPRLPRDEGAEARAVEDAGLAEDALLRKPGGVLRDVAHR